MEKILICLVLIAIAIFLYLKGKAGNKQKNVQSTGDPLPGIPDIVGRPKLGGRHVEPTNTNEPKNKDSEATVANFTKENKREVKLPVPQREPDEYTPDLKDEEEDLKGYAADAVYSIEDGLSTGITHEELISMEKLLKRKTLEASEKKTTEGIASKIDGTELMQLLEGAVGDASKRIALLLDRGEPTETDSGSSIVQNNDEDNFNIGDYI